MIRNTSQDIRDEFKRLYKNREFTILINNFYSFS